MNETLFYVCGIALAVSAVLFSFIGLKFKNFPGKAFPLVVLWFVVLAGGATTFAVLHAKDEQDEKAAEFKEANHEIEKEEGDLPSETAGSVGEESEQGGEESTSEAESEEGEAPAEAGATTTLQLAADPTQIAYDTTSLEAKAGKVTIDFDNPAALEHDVAIEKDGEEIAASEAITEGKTSVTANLEPGTYTFLCTIPGHAEAGMEGTLIVK